MTDDDKPLFNGEGDLANAWHAHHQRCSRQVTMDERINLCRAIERAGLRNRAGRALADLLNAEIDPSNFDQSLRMFLSDMERAIKALRHERRKILFPDVFNG